MHRATNLSSCLLQSTKNCGEEGKSEGGENDIQIDGVCVKYSKVVFIRVKNNFLYIISGGRVMITVEGGGGRKKENVLYTYTTILINAHVNLYMYKQM